MKCQKCGGLMVFQTFYQISESFNGWRCINCGEIIDFVIRANRMFWKPNPPGSRMDLPKPYKNKNKFNTSYDLSPNSVIDTKGRNFGISTEEEG